MSQDSYSERIGRLLYAKTDEKRVVTGVLTRLFAGRRFEHALDVGAGPGLVTAPLAAAAKRLTIVEIDPGYRETLEKAFPAATVVTDSIARYAFPTRYDAILCSQNLYYYPEAEWLPFCERLYGALAPGGLLVLVLNSDSGDWWRIVAPFWERLRTHLRFHYVPTSRFVGELAARLGPVERMPLKYRLTFDSTAEIAEFIGRQALQIYDETVLQAHAGEFARLAEALVAANGGPVLNVDSELVVASCASPGTPAGRSR